jgi:hypothetical protein
MKIEKIIPKDIDELSCAEEIGIAKINETPCLIVKGPKKDGTMHYTVIPADLLGEHLHTLFGPMDEFLGEDVECSRN